MSATYEQTPSPQETQFAGVLQMGVQELRDYVETALQENPVFELSDPGEEMLEDPNFARKREWLEAGDWQDSYYQGQDEEDGSRDPLSRMGYYLSDENDLSRFVLSQFIGTKLEPEVLQAVELLCDRLDDDGFLSEDPAELAASLGVSDAVISRALTELQAADPAGVGARDRTECLSLQIERHAGDHRLARMIVEQFMDELAENGYGAISRKTGASEALVREECDLIRSLNPRPGTGFSRRENLSYVTPDVLVLPGEDEELEVQVNGGGLPPLPAGQGPEEGLHPGTGGRLLRLRRGELALHTAGAQGGQDGGGALRAEEEGGRGRPLLHSLQEDVLVRLGEEGAVREDVDLPLPLVGADVGIGADIADRLRREELVLRVLNGDHIRVDAGEDLPAGVADAAGAALLRRALHGGGSKLRGGGAVSPGEEEGVGQGAALRRRPQPGGRAAALVQFPGRHGVPPLSTCIVMV